MLRLGDQSFRTCLTCLGQGSLPGQETARTTVAVILPVAASCQGPASQPVTNAASSAAR